MAYLNPSVSDFKNYFVRDFPYGTNIEKNVVNADIARAQSDAAIQINDALFVDQAEYNVGFHLLSAHYLCINLQSSSQGLSGKFEWPLGSRSVGSVSVSQSIPTAILENPVFAFYTTTNYGAQYIMMIYTRLIGTVISIAGDTQP